MLFQNRHIIETHTSSTPYAFLYVIIIVWQKRKLRSMTVLFLNKLISRGPPKILASTAMQATSWSFDN